MSDDGNSVTPDGAEDGTVLQKPFDRRGALGMIAAGVATGVAAASACRPLNAATPEERELKVLEWQEFTQKH